jgi:group I intron endonuclease
MNIYTIYKITNTLNGMSYIGYSKKVEFRWNQYRKIKPGRSYKRKIERAISKYGIDNFEFSILYQSLNRDHTLDEMEQHFIDEFDTIANGYNMRVGGQWAHSDYQTAEEVKAKISKIVREKMQCPEIRRKISEANKKRKHSDSTKLKIRGWSRNNPDQNEIKISNQKTSMRNYWQNPSDAHKRMGDKLRLANLGKIHSDETKAKISANNRSSVVWILGWDGEYHFVKDNVNDFVNQNMPFKHPVIYTSLKKHPDYDDKSKLVWGVKGRGPSAGFTVIRIPDTMLGMGNGLVAHLTETTKLPIDVDLEAL